MPTAIVTGATGILGGAIVKNLGARKEWTKIHALSRSKKDEYPPSVEHNHIDLTGSVDDLAKDLKVVEGDYLFFAAYLQDESEQKMCEINGGMLRSFLQALQKTGAAGKLKRVILVTGAKQYMLQTGVTKLPMEESDPWIEGGDWPPNFYYVQQRILKEESEKCKWDWTVTYPNDVIGYAKGNFMNLSFTLGLYAAVTKELGSETLPFPGSTDFYTCFDCFTDANYHADFCHWAATAPSCSNQAFNVVNGDIVTWSSMWRKVAARFGLILDPEDLSKPAPDGVITKLAPSPPASVTAKENGLVGYYNQSVVEMRIDLEKWAKRDDVKTAWKRVADREGLNQDAFEKATLGFLNFVLGRNFNIVISMTKARKAGWTGYVDTWEAFENVFDKYEELRMLPRTG